MSSHELIVVGAGALGAATAWQATELGVDDVLVLDRGAACSGTSPLGAGLVSRLLWRPDAIGFVDRSIEHLRALDEATGPRFTFHETGGIVLVGPEHADDARRMLRVWRAQGVDVERVEPRRLVELPGSQGLRVPSDEHAYVTDGDGWAVTTDTVQAMLDRVEAAGGEMRAHTPADRVADGAVRLAEGDRLTADAIVVAAGVWTRALLRDGWQPPIQAYRAQAAVLDHGQGSTPGPVVHDVPNHTYWRPEGPDKLVIGDGTDLSPQAIDEPPQADGRFASKMLDRLAARWPAAEGSKLVRAWAGYAAATPDARPLVGPVPGMETVHLCTGGNGFGFMRSPALGEVAAHLALGRAPPLPARGCRPARFDPPPTAFEMQEGYAPGAIEVD